MEKEYKQVKFRLSSWRKLRKQFYGRKNETFSDYIERIALFFEINRAREKGEMLILAKELKNE